MTKRKSKPKKSKGRSLSKRRRSSIDRKTRETNISVRLSIDGTGKSNISTGIRFLDHMLELFATHGLFDIDIRAKGDLDVDIHHTNEDVAICLGQAFAKALGNRKGIRRFGSFYVPMGSALTRVVIDLSSRPHFSWSGLAKDSASQESAYGADEVKHFFESFAQNLGANLRVDLISGDDLHHSIESMFKAFAKALDQATQIDPRIKGVPSTKGML